MQDVPVGRMPPVTHHRLRRGELIRNINDNASSQPDSFSARAADTFLPVVRTGKNSPVHPVNPVRKIIESQTGSTGSCRTCPPAGCRRSPTIACGEVSLIPNFSDITAFQANSFSAQAADTILPVIRTGKKDLVNPVNPVKKKQ